MDDRTWANKLNARFSPLSMCKDLWQLSAQISFLI
jgi:hypothetical protein